MPQTHKQATDELAELRAENARLQRSTLERGDEIEREFFMLKAQEWACEPHEARSHIIAALASVRDFFIARRRDREHDAEYAARNVL